MRIEKSPVAVVLCLLGVFFLGVVGCSERNGESEPPSPTGTDAQAAAVDSETPVGDVQAAAETMSIESLKATALKYKEAILAKQDEIAALTARVKEIPMTEALGQEAQSLKADLAELENALKALQERFQVYYDTLKDKGGDLSGLDL
jgi:hypothetical protein